MRQKRCSNCSHAVFYMESDGLFGRICNIEPITSSVGLTDEAIDILGRDCKQHKACPDKYSFNSDTPNPTMSEMSVAASEAWMNEPHAPNFGHITTYRDGFVAGIEWYKRYVQGEKCVQNISSS